MIRFGWMKSSVCVPKMGQLRTWMTDCITEVVLLLKIRKFSGSICSMQDSRMKENFGFVLERDHAGVLNA